MSTPITMRAPISAVVCAGPAGGIAPVQLYKYQEIDLGFMAEVLRQHGGAYLGWSRGLGKTLGAAAIMDELDAQRTLIVAPNTSKHAVWEAELNRFLPRVKVLVLPNDKVKRERMMVNQVLPRVQGPMAL